MLSGCQRRSLHVPEMWLHISLWACALSLEDQLEFRVFLLVPRRVPSGLFATVQQRNNIKLYFLRRFHHE